MAKNFFLLINRQRNVNKFTLVVDLKFLEIATAAATPPPNVVKGVLVEGVGVVGLGVEGVGVVGLRVEGVVVVVVVVVVEVRKEVGFEVVEVAPYKKENLLKKCHSLG